MTQKFHICAANVIERDGKFLLVQETKEIVRGKYNLPGGRLEIEERIVDAAVREAEEETGLKVRPQKLVGAYQRILVPEGNNIVTFVFASEVLSGRIRTSKKHPIVQFFSLNEIKIMGKQGLLRNVWLLEAIEDYLSGKSYDLSSVKSYIVNKADL